MTCDEPCDAFGRAWKRCPWREVSDNREIAAVMSLRSAASLSPLHAWPDTYVAWSQQLWARVESAKADRERSERQERELKAGH